jgi:bifunctional non-homologous end joining protein LigD
MAVHVEDHPVSYADFEGTIPPRQYGAGTVIVWDRGEWEAEGDARRGLAEGKLKFELHGDKLRGHWTLVRMRGKGEKQEPWLLIKEQDAEARPLADYDVVEAEPDSVLTGRDVDHPPDLSYGRKAEPAKPPTARKAAAPKPRRATLPERLEPELATLEGDEVRCITRNGNDWTSKLPALAKSLAQLPTRSAWLDGEIVVAGKNGAPDFQALQNAFDRRATADIVYWLFDAPFLDGEDLRALPVEERRARLAKLLGKTPPAGLRLSEAFDATPRELLASTAELGFEGIIGKRKGSAYVSRRSPDWIKLKNQRRQEFAIGGHTAPKGSRTGFGSLLLGVYDDSGRLQYCGNVGTGFDTGRLADIKAKLDRLASDECPFEKRPAGVKAQWVQPKLVAEIAFGEWTRDGRVRHAVFQGLRSDKPASQIRREQAQPPAAIRQAQEASPTMKALNITNAQRVIDKTSGVTKGELVAYYDQVGELMLPHLKGRPVALVRAPEGVGGELFFQKHASHNEMQGVKLLDPALDPEHEPLLQIDSVQGLLSAAQMNVLELHTWNATSNAIDRPDRFTLDLDPGEGVEWATMQEATLLVQTLLDELALPAFLKTSGGKGMHVVVPIRRHYGWDAVKGFAQALVIHLAETIPERFVAKSGPRNRVGKIFVDYLRNGFGATTVSAWSVRARPGLGVSVPIEWDELPMLQSAAQWTVRTIGERLAVGNEPWAAMEKSRKGLAAAMKRLGYEPSDAP